MVRGRLLSPASQDPPGGNAAMTALGAVGGWPASSSSSDAYGAPNRTNRDRVRLHAESSHDARAVENNRGRERRGDRPAASRGPIDARPRADPRDLRLRRRRAARAPPLTRGGASRPTSPPWGRDRTPSWLRPRQHVRADLTS